MDIRNNHVIRIISTVVLSFFLWTFGGFYELAYALKTHQKPSPTAHLSKKKISKKEFHRVINDIEKILTKADADGHSERVKKLKAKYKELQSLDREIRRQFAETDKRLKDKGLPHEIRKRHEEFVKHYNKEFEKLTVSLQDLEKSKTDAHFTSALEKLKEQISKLQTHRKFKSFDPDKLPHRTPKPIKRKPRLTKEEFRDNLALPPPENTQTSTLSSDVKTSLQSNTSLQTGNLPTDADLAETIEVQFTPEIQAKAEELRYNPVTIYNWVRNNIDFVPTYGSIQGAHMCLQTKKCNAFDTASLLIALLRVSQVPSKYVFGTVEVPTEEIMNWTGGFNNPMDSMELMSMGGIPVTGLTVGSEIKYIRFEHVWVKAWIDYIPSQGAKHKTGHGDTWIKLDGSFKQYHYSERIDMKEGVSFDAESFIEQLKSTAKINEDEGYITGIDSLFIQQTMDDYKVQIENYMNQNYPDATVDDILGKKEIIPQECPYLLGTLPYRVIVSGQKTAIIPNNLRHTISFKLTKDMYDEITGTPIIITKSLPEIAGKKITLSYCPATQADEDVINSYLPEPHADGTPIDPSELPTSLPAYLINVKPELRINGEVAASGTPVRLGEKESFTMTFTAPYKSSDLISNEIKAGEYYGIAIDTGSISEEQLQTLKTNLDSTKAKIMAEDYSNLTKEDIVGDLLYTTALKYSASLNIMDYLYSKMIGIVTVRLPSEAKFSLELSADYAFGIPISVSSKSLAMDVDRILSAVKAINGDKDKCKQFILSSGMVSSLLEHLVPEQMFSSPDNPGEGISAVKALQIANNQKIPIYTLNQKNINSILPQLQLDAGTIEDIRNAVNAGKEVTVSKTDITINRWTGCGYIIIDPDTGAGAYMISGGLNGGEYNWYGLLLVALGTLLFIIGIITIPGTLAALPMSIAILLYIGYGYCIYYQSVYIFYFFAFVLLGAYIPWAIGFLGASVTIQQITTVLIGSIGMDIGGFFKAACEDFWK